jgi:NADPH-dependent 2,4-dienoyl-CoA reductase/sulfur reductase-like enzyme
MSIQVVIIGNGVAGTTAARFIRKLDSSAQITLISDESDLFFARTGLMYVLMGQIPKEDLIIYTPQFYQNNRIHRQRGRVQRIDTTNHLVLLADNTTPPIPYHRLVLATGAKPYTANWHADGIYTLYSWHDMELLQAQLPATRHAVIVGGGLIGVELAEILHSRGINFTMLVRDEVYWASHLPPDEASLITAHLQKKEIPIRYNVQLADVLTDQNKVIGITTTQGEHIACDMLLLAIGVQPRTELDCGGAVQVQQGFVVNEYLQTSAPDVFAAGDCVHIAGQQPYSTLPVAMWYTARAMGEVVAYNVCGKAVPYKWGIGHNAAKFFDVEYQVYGWVPSTIGEGLASIYWQHTVLPKSIRLVWEVHTKALVGVCVMGIRYRQAVCTHWIQGAYRIERVLEMLLLANFDGEFSEVYESQVVEKYNAAYGTSLVLKSKRSADAVAFLLGRNTLTQAQLAQKSAYWSILGGILGALSCLLPICVPVQGWVMLVSGLLFSAGVGFVLLGWLWYESSKDMNTFSV